MGKLASNVVSFFVYAERKTLNMKTKISITYMMRILQVGGDFRPDGQKTVWTTFYCRFLSPQLINLFYSLQRASNGFITEKTILFPKFQRGSTIFQGSPTFSRGVQMLISIETHITCDFPVGGGGSGPPIPPSGVAHAHRPFAKLRCMFARKSRTCSYGNINSRQSEIYRRKLTSFGTRLLHNLVIRIDSNSNSRSSQ